MGTQAGGATDVRDCASAGRRCHADLRRGWPAQGHADRPRHRGEGARSGKDPSSTAAGELGEAKPGTIGADDSVDEAL